MIVTRQHLSRRTLLRGTGIALALPMLDGMVPAFAATRNAAPPVKRFGAMYVGMGMDMRSWTQAAGPLVMNPIVQPLTAHRDRVVVVAGLDSKGAISNDQGQHPRAQAAWLSGCRAKKTDGPDIRLGTSLDQIIAKEMARETQLGSLELTVEPTDLAGSCAYGFSCAYNNTIAWRTPTTPLPMENNPRSVFERLFGASDSTDRAAQAKIRRANASVLDSLIEQVGGFTRGLGPSDRQKLGEYLDAVRDAERRIQRAEQQADRELPAIEQPTGIPAAYEDYVRLMLDLQLLAFQTDMTRVSTFVLARESSIRSYPEIGVPDSHHPLSHHQNNAEKLARLARVNLFHMKQFGYLVDRLAATPDGDGSMLDSTMLLYGSGMSDSNLHIPTNVPTLLVSGKRFGIAGNRYIQAPERTPLANLQLTMLDRFGMPMEQFGDSNGELPMITAV
ncbi:MAG: DUF1552 domain-containing protein [Vicinamibacterales bacterium]